MERQNKTTTTNKTKAKESETWIYKVPTKYDIEMSGLSVFLPPSLGFWPKWSFNAAVVVVSMNPMLGFGVENNKIFLLKRNPRKIYAMYDSEKRSTYP